MKLMRLIALIALVFAGTLLMAAQCTDGYGLYLSWPTSAGPGPAMNGW